MCLTDNFPKANDTLRATFESFCVFVLLVAYFAPTARGEQEIVLESGTKLIGDVRLQDDLATISIAGSEMELPLAKIISIAPAGTNPGKGSEAGQLLRIALEARLLNSERMSTELLAHAHKLQPSNPQIAFWYAHALIEDGEGIAAEGIYREHEHSIKAAYPVWAKNLLDKISQRVALEKYPARLVARLDELAKDEPPSQRNNNEHTWKQVLFRIRDQKGKPLRQAEFRIQCRANNEQLEAFDEGLYLFTFQQYSNSQNVCELDVTNESLENEKFELISSTLHDSPRLIEITAHRFDDRDKYQLKAKVLDAQGAPIANATLRLMPISASSRSSLRLTATTDQDGNASLAIFARKYSFTTSATGYIGRKGTIDGDVRKNSDKPLQLVMRPAIRARLHLAWVTQDQGDSSKISTNQHTFALLGPHATSSDAHLPTWLRPVQHDDRLFFTLFSNAKNYGGVPDHTNSLSAWIRAIPSNAETEENTNPKKRASLYESIDLTNLADIEEKYPLAKKDASAVFARIQNGSTYAATNGTTLVGQINTRANRGRPQTVVFKAFVEILD